MAEDRVPPKGLPTSPTVAPAPPIAPFGAGTPVPSRKAELDAKRIIGHAQTLSAKEADAPTFGPGLKLRQYELIRELGRGGMGQVFLARDTKLARRVAIKFLASYSRELTERFIAEARTTAMVSHENIVVIYEVDEHDGAPHMVLEYLEGTSMRELLHGRAYAPSRALELLTPIVRAVARAHAAGVVHRDLKPENILVTVDGTVKVLDFGIAKALAGPDAPRKLSLEDLQNLEVTAQRAASSSVIIGTPQYMSPEQFNGVVDHRSDLWAIGVIAFELLTGRHPLAPYTLASLVTNAMLLNDPMPKIGTVVHDLPERLERLVDRCLAKHKEQRYDSADELLADLEALMPGRFGRRVREDDNPYPGLTAFQEEDADRFFGRSRDISRMVTRLRDQPLVGIAGPSGIGKSSFVRAGVVPALKGSGEAWETFIVRPGRQPLTSLAGVLAPLTRTNTLDGTRQTTGDTLKEQGNLVERLQREPGYLGALLRERAARKNTRILLFVDQFEELYTLVSDPAERRAFTAALAGAADDATSPIRIVVSVRSDFLDRVGEDRAFLDDLTRGLVFLQPLGRPELCEALTRPLDMLGYDFDTDDLVDKMLAELATATGALPLMQFAAARLWDARDRKNKHLTTSAYEAMGGIAGALATHADHTLAAIPLASHRIVRDVFHRLITPDRTRAIAELTDLEGLADAADVRRVIDQLVAARLLVVQTDGDARGATVEIVHESLIEGWPKLRRWLDEDQEDAAFLANLSGAAKQWEAMQRAPGVLWRGEPMEEARRWYTQRPRPLPARDQAFLDEVFALARKTTRAKRMGLVAAFVVLGAIAAGASIAYVRVRAAEQVATQKADEAKKALAAKIAEEKARIEADEARIAALAALVTEEQLRQAAEAGLISAEQVAQIAEIKRRDAERLRKKAEAGLALAAHERAQLARSLARAEADKNQAEADKQKAEADKRAAEEAAALHAADAQMTREQLLAKTQELVAALALARREAAKAEAARVAAEKANTALQKSLANEKERAERLEREKKKITTDLK